MPASPRPRLRLEDLESREVPAFGLDPTFGTGGLAADPLAGTKFQLVGDVVAAPGGKIVAAGNLPGTGWYGSDGDVAVARLTATGAADPTFGGGDGVVSLAFAQPHTAAAVATQADGKVVVAGTFPPAGNAGTTIDLFVLRLNADGTRDTSFGTAGEVTLDLGGTEVVRGVVVRPDGKIVLAGSTLTNPSPAVYENHLAVVQLTSGGARDGVFGANGVVLATAIGSYSGALALQPDGKLVVAGQIEPRYTPPYVESGEFDVYRFNADGTPDTAFGVGGHSQTAFGDYTSVYASAVAVLADGRIVVGGSGFGSGLLAWFRPDGSLIQGEKLGDDSTPVPTPGLSWVGDVAAAPGGGAVVSGSTNSGRFAVERHPEPGAGIDLLNVNPGSNSAGGAGLVVGSDGKVVMVGAAGYSPYPNPDATGATLTAVRFADPGVTRSRTSFVQPLILTAQPGTSATLAVQVIPLIGSPVTEGTVTFREGTRVLGSVTVSAGDDPMGVTGPGVATFQAQLDPGRHTITASFAGTTNWAASAATFDTVVMSPSPAATVSLRVSDDNPALGEAVTLTATVTNQDGSAAVGVVTFFDGMWFLGTAIPDATGTATLSVTTLTAGSHWLRAEFPGGTSPVVVDVTRAYTEVALSASTRTPAVGQSVTLTAAVTAPTSTGIVPIGSVTFYDGRTPLGTAPVVNGRTTLTAALPIGARTLRAAYNGDAQTFGSDAAPLGITVTKATTAATLTAPGTIAAGLPVTLTANVRVTAGSAFPIGTVEFREGTRLLGVAPVDGRGAAKLVLPSLPAGGHAITAAYLGCSTCAGSTSPAATVTVGGPTAPAATTTALAPLSAAVHGQPQALAATVSAAGKTPSGRVDFYDGTKLVGSAAVGTGGKATLGIVGNLGAHKWRAVFVAGAGFLGSESAVVSHTVGKAGASAYAAVEVEVIRVTVRPAFGGSPIGTVTFRENGVVVGTAAVNGNGVATLKLSQLAPGRHRLTAAYSGSSTFLGCESAAFDVLAVG